MEDLLKLENQVCFPAYAFSRKLTNLYRPLLQELDLTYPQYLVMMVLWEEKTLTVNKIGEKLDLDSGTLTPLLKRLEQKDFVNRIRSKTDERVVIVSLTETGLKLKTEAKDIPKNLLKCLEVSLEELLQLKGLLTKILDK